MNPRNINRHQSLARRVREREVRRWPNRRTERVRAGGSEGRNDVSTFVIPTTLFITVAEHAGL